ncbi:MAG TPA: hypothetical protein VK327_12745 [Candidatus Paceibacterota bacterium]|nr:hypothetical protein [Candidatus Paceibacterota bacterium]
MIHPATSLLPVSPATCLFLPHLRVKCVETFNPDPGLLSLRSSTVTVVLRDILDRDERKRLACAPPNFQNAGKGERYEHDGIND